MVLILEILVSTELDNSVILVERLFICVCRLVVRDIILSILLFIPATISPQFPILVSVAARASHNRLILFRLSAMLILLVSISLLLFCISNSCSWNLAGISISILYSRVDTLAVRPDRSLTALSTISFRSLRSLITFWSDSSFFLRRPRRYSSIQPILHSTEAVQDCVFFI